MVKIHWFEEEHEGDWKGLLLPNFKIYEDLAGRLRLYISDDRPQSIIIKSVRAGKLLAAKYLKKKIFEEFGA